MCVYAVARSQILNEISFVLSAVWVCARAMTRAHIILPVSGVPNILIWPDILAVTVLLIHNPFALINVSAVLCINSHFALPVALIISPIALINRFISIDHGPLAVFLAFFPLAFVLIVSLGPDAAPTTLHLILHEFTIVGRAIRPPETSLALSEIVYKDALVNGLVSERESSITLSFVELVFTFVFTAAGPRVHAEAVAFVADPLALVVAAIVKSVVANFSRWQISEVFVKPGAAWLLRHFQLK